jgi:hypothetical protein
MRIKDILLAASLLTSACERPGLQPADFVILFDKSPTSPLSNDEAFAAAMGKTLSTEFLTQKPLLGDSVVILTIGDRDTKSAIARRIPINRQYRPPAVAQYLGKVTAQVPRSSDRSQSESSILFPLTHGNFKCTPKRGRIWVVSDLLNNDADFSDVQGLVNGTAQLPLPDGKPLTNCRVSLRAVGLTADGTQQLNSAQIANLVRAYRTWFTAAGVAPGDLDFSTGI